MPRDFEKLTRAHRRELNQLRLSSIGKEGPPSKRQRFSREDSRNKETRALVSKLVAKELAETNKAEQKKEVKGEELKAQVMDILEEAIRTTNLGAPVSSNSATIQAASNSVLKSILKKDRAKS